MQRRNFFQAHICNTDGMEADKQTDKLAVAKRKKNAHTRQSTKIHDPNDSELTKPEQSQLESYFNRIYVQTPGWLSVSVKVTLFSDEWVVSDGIFWLSLSFDIFCGFFPHPIQMICNLAAPKIHSKITSSRLIRINKVGLIKVVDRTTLRYIYVQWPRMALLFVHPHIEVMHALLNVFNDIC